MMKMGRGGGGGGAASGLVGLMRRLRPAAGVPTEVGTQTEVRPTKAATDPQPSSRLSEKLMQCSTKTGASSFLLQRLDGCHRPIVHLESLLGHTLHVRRCHGLQLIELRE